MGKGPIECWNCHDPITECTCENPETYETSEGPACPYCGEVNKVGDSDGQLYDEGTTEYSCGFCDRTFGLDIQMSYSWLASRIEDDKDNHDKS